MTTILVLQANPLDQTALRLAKEARIIRERIQDGELRRWAVESVGAVRKSEVIAMLLKHRPDIVHFSGHATDDGELVFEDENGESETLSPTMLAQVLQRLDNKVQCVVLNACYSATLAAAIAEAGSCVIGMEEGIGDEAALTFSSSFYRCLSFGKSIRMAFDLAKLDVAILDKAEGHIPKLVPAPGIDPNSLRLDTREPYIVAEFALTARGRPRERSGGYVINFCIKNAPEDTLAAVYDFNHKTVPHSARFEEVPNDGDSFFTERWFYGDIQVRATLWRPGGGVAIATRLIHALERAHGTSSSTGVGKALAVIREE